MMSDREEEAAVKDEDEVEQDEDGKRRTSSM